MNAKEARNIAIQKSKTDIDFVMNKIVEASNMKQVFVLIEKIPDAVRSYLEGEGFRVNNPSSNKFFIYWA